MRSQHSVSNETPPFNAFVTSHFSTGPTIWCSLGKLREAEGRWLGWGGGRDWGSACGLGGLGGRGQKGWVVHPVSSVTCFVINSLEKILKPVWGYSLSTSSIKKHVYSFSFSMRFAHFLWDLRTEQSEYVYFPRYQLFIRFCRPSCDPRSSEEVIKAVS